MRSFSAAQPKKFHPCASFRGKQDAQRDKVLRRRLRGRKNPTTRAAQKRAVQGVRVFPDGNLQIVNDRGKTQQDAVMRSFSAAPSIKTHNFPASAASKTRSASTDDGSLQAVNDQGGTQRDKVLRRRLRGCKVNYARSSKASSTRSASIFRREFTNSKRPRENAAGRSNAKLFSRAVNKKEQSQ